MLERDNGLMRRSTGMLLLGTELAVLSWWFLSLRFETGLDALQYHRMANAIVHNGLAPWVINPLSYIGIYPGSDSSGVPFLAASFSLVSGTSIGATVLVYDAVLRLVFGLGLFVLTRQLTDRADLALLAILIGSFSYGFFSTLSWSLDERSFNVALAPLFLFLMLPRGTRTTMHESAPRFVALGLESIVMFVSHLNFLLLLPFLILVPLLHEVVRHQRTVRRKRRASLLYYGMIGLSPLFLLTALNQLGILSDFGLDYQLESSALFSGSSPLIFLANAMVFLGTRVGPVNLFGALLGLLYLASRPYLPSRSILLGGFLLVGFLGLPVVLYSKDMLTPIFALLGAIGLGNLIRQPGRRRVLALTLSAILVVSGSVAFDTWNTARTSRAADAAYWAMPGVTPEAQAGNLWISAEDRTHGCIYGNNAVALWQVTTGARVSVCNGLSVDLLINMGTSAVVGSPPFHVLYAGVSGVNPSDWFTSPELTRMSNDFARLPTLSFAAGRSLLLKYNVSLIVVDLRKPFEVPLYGYQGTYPSAFFTDLWNNLYPLYRSGNFAVFRIQ